METELGKFVVGTAIGLVTGALNALAVAGVAIGNEEQQKAGDENAGGCLSAPFALYFMGLMGALTPTIMSTGGSGWSAGLGITVGHEVGLHAGIKMLSDHHFKNKKP